MFKLSLLRWAEIRLVTGGVVSNGLEKMLAYNAATLPPPRAKKKNPPDAAIMHPSCDFHMFPLHLTVVFSVSL